MFGATLIIIFMQLFVNATFFCNATICLGLQEDTNFVASKIQLRHYYGDPWKPNSTNFSIEQPEKIAQLAEPAKGLALYIHGFRENSQSESVRTIVNAYLRKNRDNLVVLDWGELAYDSYVLIVCRTKEIAKIAAKAVDKATQAGLEPKNIHIIGHSIGAHIAGFIGKYSKHSIPRVTGLDPANPGFYQFGAEHVDKASARFVDVIHTDATFYGTPVPTGTVDFYPNGGNRPQLKCDLLNVPLEPSDLCSHWASWRYYAETLMKPDAFPAVQCPSYTEYLLGLCDENERAYFGYDVPRNISGNFYFRVDPEYSFITTI